MRKTVTSSILGLATIGLLTGCPDRTISEVNPEQGRVESKSFPINLNRDVDILFVIDDSGSMADKQQNLRDNFPNFINVLNTIQGGLPNVHIGVISSDVGVFATDGQIGPRLEPVGNGGCADRGDDGRLQTGSAPVTGTFISDILLPDTTRQRNYTGDLATVFGQMASLGATGCGFEQHLHAMRRALDNNPANAGFLRPDAFLAVIFLADEDDCTASHTTLWGPDGGPLGTRQSFRCTRFGVLCDVGGATEQAMAQVGVKDQCHPNDNSQHLAKVSDFVTFLKGLKPDDPNKIIVAGILGNLDPFAVEMRQINQQQDLALAHSCSYNPPGGGQTQVADPPVRLQFFLDQFPNRSTSTSICQADLSGGLQLIGELLKESIGNPCITGQLLDTDPNADGIQPDCSVSYISNFGKPNANETPLPQCGTGPEPCWEIIKDATACPCPSPTVDPTCDVNNPLDNLILKINDPVAQPDGTQVVANCVTEVVDQ